MIYDKSEIVDNQQCYQITASPTTTDWTAAYSQDVSTNIMLNMFKNAHKPLWSNDMLQKVLVEYRSHLKEHLISMLHDKLVYYKAIFKHVKYIGLIIVPLSLRRVIFSHYHAGPSGGHMGEYKTLFRIRMRFYWPGMRKDIKLWVKICGQCVAYNTWRNRKSEMYFSWPITTPFYIMHVDLWCPGKLVDDDGKTLQLMNCMCDLTQFVISIIVDDARS